MAIAGFTDTGAFTQWISTAAGDFSEGRFTMPETGVLDEISAYIRNSNDFDRENVLILTDSSGNRIYSAPAENSGIGGGDWRTENVTSEAIELTAGDYYITIQSETGYPQLAEATGVGGSWNVREGIWGVDDDPINGTINSSSAAGRVALVHVVYTPGAGIPPAPNNPGNESLVVAADVNLTSESVGQFLTSPNPVDGDYWAFPTLTANGAAVIPGTTNENQDGTFALTVPPMYDTNDSMIVDYYDSVGEAWFSIVVTLSEGGIVPESSTIVRGPVVGIIKDIVLNIIKPIIREGEQ